MGAAHVSVLRESNPTVRIEVTRLNLSDRHLNESVKFLPLFIRDGGSQILDFSRVFSHKDNERHFGNAADP